MDAILYLGSGLIGTRDITGMDRASQHQPGPGSGVFSVGDCPLTAASPLDAGIFIKLGRGKCQICGRCFLSAQVDFYFLNGGRVLELPGGRHLWVPDQYAIRQLLRGGHRADAQSRHAAFHGRLWDVGNPHCWCFVLRELLSDERWMKIESILIVSFWGLNIAWP